MVELWLKSGTRAGFARIGPHELRLRHNHHTVGEGQWQCKAIRCGPGCRTDASGRKGHRASRRSRRGDGSEGHRGNGRPVGRARRAQRALEGAGAEVALESEAAAELEAAGEEGSDLYRGVAETHPGYENALEGIAEPRGGPASALEHNLGNTDSPFTSWTTDPEIAQQFAGPDGVIMRIPIAAGEGYQLVTSPNLFSEAEVLVEASSATPRPSSSPGWGYNPAQQPVNGRVPVTQLIDTVCPAASGWLAAQECCAALQAAAVDALQARTVDKASLERIYGIRLSRPEVAATVGGAERLLSDLAAYPGDELSMVVLEAGAGMPVYCLLLDASGTQLVGCLVVRDGRLAVG
jgi:hypothetical protein